MYANLSWKHTRTKNMHLNSSKIIVVRNGSLHIKLTIFNYFISIKMILIEA